tara:strand:+ start:36055 stop:38058 length:2004 start_codon:yes stop_codon:yes gene_type:complete
VNLNDIANVWSGDPYDASEFPLRGWLEKARYFPNNGEPLPKPSQLPKWVKPGDIVITRIGGRVFTYEGPDQKLPRNSIFIQVKRKYKNRFDQNALKYYIEQNIGTDDLRLQGSVQQFIRLRDLRNLPISGNTSLDEQVRWGNTIEDMNSLIKLEKQKLETVKNMVDIVKRKRIDFRELDWYEMQDNRELVRRMLIHKNVKPNPYVDRWLRNAPGFNENLTWEQSQELFNVALPEIQENPEGFLMEGSERAQFKVAKSTSNLVPLGFTNSDNNLEYTLYDFEYDSDGSPYYLYEVNDSSIKNLDEMREEPDVMIEVNDEMLEESMTDFFSPIQKPYFYKIEYPKTMDKQMYSDKYFHQFAEEMAKKYPAMKLRASIKRNDDDDDFDELERVNYVWVVDEDGKAIDPNNIYSNENELLEYERLKDSEVIDVDSNWINNQIVGKNLKEYVITPEWYNPPPPEYDEEDVDYSDWDYDESGVYSGWQVDETDKDNAFGDSMTPRMINLCCGQPSSSCDCKKRAYRFETTKPSKTKSKPTRFMRQYNHGTANERRGEYLNPRVKQQRMRNINGENYQMLIGGGSGASGEAVGGPYARKSVMRRRADLLRKKGYNARVIPMAGDKDGKYALFLSKKVRYSNDERKMLSRNGIDWKSMERKGLKARKPDIIFPKK